MYAFACDDVPEVDACPETGFAGALAVSGGVGLVGQAGSGGAVHRAEI